MSGEARVEVIVCLTDGSSDTFYMWKSKAQELIATVNGITNQKFLHVVDAQRERQYHCDTVLKIIYVDEA